MPMDMSSMQESLNKMLGGLNKEKIIVYVDSWLVEGDKIS